MVKEWDYDWWHEKWEDQMSDLRLEAMCSESKEEREREEREEKNNYFIEEGQKLCDQYGQMYGYRIEVKDFNEMFDDYEYVEDFLKELEEALKQYDD